MAEKSLDFENYRKYSTDPNPTTNPELQEFMSNQNRLLMELVEGFLWQPSTAYAVGQCVRSTLMPAGQMAKCTQAGTTGATEPNWGESTLDGTVRWQLVNAGGDEYAAGSGINITNGVISNTGILSLSIGVGDSNGQIKINGVNVAPKNLKTVAITGDYNDLTNKPTVDSALSSTSTNAVQNKVVKSYVDGVDPFNKNITVTGSTQQDKKVKVEHAGVVDYTTSSGSGDILQIRYYDHQVEGVTAGTYTLRNIIQQLINKSHTHKIERNNNLVNCDCTCSGG